MTIFNGVCGKQGLSSFMAAIGLFCLLAGLSGCQKFFGQNEAELAEERRQEALKNPCVVLALPNSGRYAAYAGKIKNGAAIAARQLKASGINLRLEHVNTESNDWLNQLEALPPMCMVVGGPLQDRKYEAARKAGELEKRIFFSFVPTLHPGDEGKLAWRFFPSPQDQINALVNFATDQLNIRSYGAFYPADNYGRRMTEMLEQALSRRHIPLEKASYNPSAPGSWSDSVAALIHPTTAEGSKTPLPQTRFEAIFLPDSWKNMDMLTTSMMYNGEDRLVLLGTNLWEQVLANRKVPKAEKYVLAVFPGAWDPSRAPATLKNANADMWTALGYDFINFAVNTGLASRLAASQITASAQKAASHVRALAPITWNGSGIASQNLFLFQVGPQGSRPLNLDAFRQSRSAVMEQSALRMQGIRDEAAESLTAGETSAGDAEEISSEYVAPINGAPTSAAQTNSMPENSAPALTSQPTAPPLSTIPQPSYKLRLPTKR